MGLESQRRSRGLPSKAVTKSSPRAGADPLAGKQFRDTDLANGRRFVAEHGDSVRFIADLKRWVVWDSRRWAIDQAGAIVAGLAQQTVERMADEAAEKLKAAVDEFRNAQDEDEERAKAKKTAAERELMWAKKSQDAKRITAMLEMAKPHLLVAKCSEQFDTHADLLNCPNGTVNLRTGELRNHDRRDFITKLCPTRFDPHAAAPTYLKFLDSILPDTAVAGYVRELSGYAATGEVSDQTLHIFNGKGSNGKSVLLDLWVDVLGDGEYAATAPPELIADRGESRHPTEKTVLRGTRLAACQETEDGEAMNAKRVKSLTGGNAISARGMRENFHSFKPTHTLILATNHLPRVRTNDHATWRRIRVIEFDRVFWTEADRKEKPEGKYPDDLRADTGLPEKLRAEAEGILLDMVAHANEFYDNDRRLSPPEKVMRGVAGYRKDEDIPGRFLEQWEPSDKPIRGGEFYRLFVQWFKSEIDPEGRDCPSPVVFGLQAKERFESRVTAGTTKIWARRKSESQDPETPSTERDTTGGGVGGCAQNGVNPSRETSPRGFIPNFDNNPLHPPPREVDDPNGRHRRNSVPRKSKDSFGTCSTCGGECASTCRICRSCLESETRP